MRTRSWRRTGGLLAVSVLLSLGAAEAVVRSWLGPELWAPIDERNSLYRYDAELGWFPIENSQGPFTGSHTVQVVHNRDGFRDREHGPKTKPRILFLGDSFVWGYDVEASDRFTERLAEALPRWEILNLGVSGYATDQELLLLRRVLDKYAPDIVFVVVCQDNDPQDNQTNISFGSYYKPYFAANGAALEPHGVPVPKSLDYFYAEHPQLARSYLVRAMALLWFAQRSPRPVRVPDPTTALLDEMRRNAESHGAAFRIGLQGEGNGLASALDRERLRFVSLADAEAFPTRGRHWTPEGHRFVANVIREYLIREGLVPRS